MWAAPGNELAHQVLGMFTKSGLPFDLVGGFGVKERLATAIHGYEKIYIFQQKTKPYTFSSSHVTTSKHLNFKIISLKYLNQYGFSQKSICSYKYDCLIIHKPWASRLEKISVAEGTEVVFHLR